MAESLGGGAATVSFDEVTRSAGAVTQCVRARLFSSDAKRTWLGPSAALAESIAGSVLRCESQDTGSFWMVVPPRMASVAPVRRSRSTVSVRVSRDGSVASARYEDVGVLHEIVQSIVPGILTMGNARGSLADTVKLLVSGDSATVPHGCGSPPPSGGPLFTVHSGEDVVIASSDFTEVLRELAVHEVPWGQYTSEGWWGLMPSVTAAPVCRQIQWESESDALGIASVFGLPSVSSNIDALHARSEERGVSSSNSDN